MKISYKNSLFDVWRFTMDYRSRSIPNWMLTGALVLFVVISGVKHLPPDDSLLAKVLTIGIQVVLLLCVVLILDTFVTLFNYLYGKNKNQLNLTHTITLSDDVLKEETSSNVTETKWGGLHKIKK